MESVQTMLAIAGAVVGAVLHTLKKQVETGINGIAELDVVKAYLLQKPFSTLFSAITGIGIAYGLQVDGAPPVTAFLQAVIAGFSANSAFNRPGDGG